MRSTTTRPPVDRVGGRYRLGELLNESSGAQVYRALDEVLGREVALKVLPSESEAGGPAASREARAVAGLSHPNIAAVYDIGTTPVGDRYIVFELVPGPTLRDVLRERGRLEPGEAAPIAAVLADALDAAHRQGVIHCDVKPANVVLTPDGVPKLVDFGIARWTRSVRGAATDPDPRGSAPYVAPEQARGAAVDGRADVHALGATLYEMLTGWPPFRGPTPTAVLAERLASDPVPLRAVRPEIPPALERVVLRALARDPGRRFPTAAAMRDALRSSVQGDRTVPLAIGARPEPGARWAAAPWRRVRPPAGAVVALLVGALLVALLTLAAADRRGVDASASTSTPTVAAAAPTAPPEVTTAPAPPAGNAVQTPDNPPAVSNPTGRGTGQPGGGKAGKGHGRGH